MGDACGTTSGAARKSRYWALKKYKETVDSLRQSRMGFALSDNLKGVHINSNSFTKMYGHYGRPSDNKSSSTHQSMIDSI